MTLTIMIEAAFRSLLLGAVVGAGLWILRIKAVRTRKAVWVSVLFAALLMPVTMQWHTVRITSPVASQEVTAAVLIVPLKVSRLVAPGRLVSEPSSRARKADWSAVLTRGAATLYVAAASLLIIRLLVGMALALRLWVRAAPVSLAWSNGERVRVSEAIKMPVTVGPGILLPTAAMEWDEDRLRTIIAHEQCHVDQRDFYLQFLAGLHRALFWFSPMSWWLQRQLSDLGEAISDEAGVENARDRSSYAELLLEVAQCSDHYVAGVAMARSGNLGRRIERILSEARPATVFTWRRGVALAAVFLPVVAVTAGATISTGAGEPLAFQSPLVAPTPPAAPARPLAPTPAAPVLAPAAPAPTAAPELVENNWSWFSDDSGESYAIVSGGELTMMNGSSRDASRARRYESKTHSDYIWFTRNGKAYIIDEPGLVRQAKELFKPQEELGRQQALLGERQAKLGELQAKLGRQQEEVAIPAPEVEKKLQALEAQIAELRARMRNLKNQRVQQDDLSSLQERLSEMQGVLGSDQEKLGELQGELGEKQGKLGEEQGRLGEEQGKLAQEATRKLEKMIDQAVRDSKAKRSD